jgi:hypothetical protein
MGESTCALMGPFEHSTEREFALTVNRKAIDDCTSLTQLEASSKELAGRLVVHANCFSKPDAGKHSTQTSHRHAG